MRTRWLWLGLFLWLSPGAWAWVDEGHDLVARIAVRHLEPSTLTALQRLLEAHPHGVKTLEEASYWPDRVRDVPRYHRESWHFVNIPYFADSSGLEVRYPGRDILYALNLNTRRLKNRELSERERAIALCWVTHLIGDIHQPLHCAQLFNRHFPGGDRGGNDFKVRLREREITLHLLWDMQGGFFSRRRQSISPRPPVPGAGPRARVGPDRPSSLGPRESRTGEVGGLPGSGTGASGDAGISATRPTDR